MTQTAKEKAEQAKKRFPVMCTVQQVPPPVMEYRFHAKRLWRFDYAWPALKVALEVEGGGWTGGRHTSGSGFAKDMEKYNYATAMGWAVLRVSPGHLLKPEIFAFVRATMLRRHNLLAPAESFEPNNEQP